MITRYEIGLIARTRAYGQRKLTEADVARSGLRKTERAMKAEVHAASIARSLVRRD